MLRLRCPRRCWLRRCPCPLARWVFSIALLGLFWGGGGTATVLWGQDGAPPTLTAKLKSESPDKLAADARLRGDAARGAALFPKREVGCSSCHAVGGQQLLGPDLSQKRDEVDDVYLVESVLNPAKVIRKGFETVTIATGDGRIYSGRLVKRDQRHVVLRSRDTASPTSGGNLLTFSADDIESVAPSKVSLMPENLADSLRDRQQFLDLIRYLMQLADTATVSDNATQPAPRQLSRRVEAIVALDKFQCGQCHEALKATARFSPYQAPHLAWSVGRVDPQYVKRLLAGADSVAQHSPDTLHGLNVEQRLRTVEALTHFWMSLAAEPTEFSRSALDVEAASRGRDLFHRIGCVACHSPRDDSGRPLRTDSVRSLTHLNAKYNLSGLVEFLKDPHASRPSGRMPSLNLSHFEATDIANYLLRSSQATAAEHSAGALAEEANSLVDARLAAEGKRLFTKHHCANCHSGATGETDETKANTSSAPKALRQLDRGCLADAPGATVPHYHLSAGDRDLLREAIRDIEKPLAMQDSIDATLAALNCLACHQRDGLGGVSGIATDYFTTTNPNLGPQGSFPPPLSGVGAKLRAAWLRQVLVSSRRIRPYMHTRMPQYGTDNVEHLVQLLKQADHLPEVPVVKVGDPKELKKTATDIVGSQGLNCVACHTFQHKPGQTMPAVDLTEMGERLERDWFMHYMDNPQRFHRGTVMPTFWPGGRAMRKDFLDGDAALQKEAIWLYLQDGRQARTPRGLVIEPIELLAGDEAVMLRRSYPGIGKRGIGVGYPSQVNLVFDAEQIRVGLLWQGQFADPGGVWRSQGHGTVRPLSREVQRFTKGPELDFLKNPWEVDEGRPPHHQFAGYYLDAKRRPTFMYRVDDVAVEDGVVDQDDPPALTRTLVLVTPTQRNDLRFRIASGKRLVREEASSGDAVSLVIDDRWRVKVIADGGRTGSLRLSEVSEGDDQQLTAADLPLKLPAGETTLVLRYEWLAP